jgi:hypothetical protein
MWDALGLALAGRWWRAAAAGNSAGRVAASGGGQKVDPATAGDINGVVAFEGTAPKGKPIKMNADPVREGKRRDAAGTETYQVADGKLGNVRVNEGRPERVRHAHHGRDDRSEELPLPSARVRRHGESAPRILNSDPTLHNIHALPKDNKEFNNGQPIQGMKMAHTFTAKEVMVPFKCDVHGWMNAYVGVVEHPYFQVTAKDGKFSLKGLPPGTYTIEAWHEKLGAQELKVTLGAKETKDANFSFKAAAAATD